MILVLLSGIVSIQLNSQGISSRKDIHASRVVVAQGGYFPKLLLRKNGELLATFKTGAPHSGKTGRASLSRSVDGGYTWSRPVTIFDIPDADDSTDALGELSDGTLLFAAVSYTWKGEQYSDESFRADTYVIHSHDDGATWMPPLKVNTTPFTWSYPYGRILTLDDGTLLLSCFGGYLPKDSEDSQAHSERQPAKREELRGDFAFVVRSHDGGKTWGNSSLVARHYNEITIMPLKNGALLAVIRSDTGGHLATTISSDQGQTWSAPKQITADQEHPGDLIRLADGRILMSYGERNRPYGIRALLSSDEGISWDKENTLELATDGDHPDLGYAVSVQRNDRALVTLYYVVYGNPIFNGSEDGVVNAFTKAIIWQLPDSQTRTNHASH